MEEPPGVTGEEPPGAPVEEPPGAPVEEPPGAPVEEPPGIPAGGTPETLADEHDDQFLSACVSSSSCVGVCVWHHVMSDVVLNARVVSAVGHGAVSWEWEERDGRAG